MSQELKAKIESLLFVSYKPQSSKKLAELLGVDKTSVVEVWQELQRDYQEQNRGWRLLINDDKAQLVSAPANAELVKDYLQDETTGELTPASLETLTIVAYRQPVTKAELEQIRGINCSLILRNLLIRGLIEANYDKTRATTVYSVTADLLKLLGLTSVSELPDYDKLNSDENLQKLLLSTSSQDDVSEQVVKVEVKLG